MFRKVRITILLYVLLLIAGGTWLTAARSTDWDEPLWVALYPIDGDGRTATRRYIERLDVSTFESVATFLAEEAEHYSLPLARPVTLRLAPEVAERPPPPPTGGNPLQIAWWSLRLRFWASSHGDYDGPEPDIRVFVIFHDPTHVTRVAHSLGLQKGLIGVVNAFASRSMAGSNNVIIAHEVLHTLGATDKYDPATGAPIYPDGYGDPTLDPRHPQSLAELMGGRIAVSPTRHEVPRSLREVVIGEMTAREIRWIE